MNPKQLNPKVLLDEFFPIHIVEFLQSVIRYDGNGCLWNCLLNAVNDNSVFLFSMVPVLAKTLHTKVNHSSTRRSKFREIEVTSRQIIFLVVSRCGVHSS